MALQVGWAGKNREEIPVTIGGAGLVAKKWQNMGSFSLRWKNEKKKKKKDKKRKNKIKNPAIAFSFA